MHQTPPVIQAQGRQNNGIVYVFEEIPNRKGSVTADLEVRRGGIARVPVADENSGNRVR